MPEIINIFNFLHFAPLLKIKHKEKRILIDFHPTVWTEPQKYLHNFWESLREAKELIWLLILKARQPGISTYVESRIFHSTITSPNTNSLILADKKERSEYIFQMCRTMYDYLPEDPLIKPQVRYSSKKEFIFDTKDGKGLKSAIYVSTALDQFIGQAQTLHNIHCSEASSFPYLGTVFTTLIPAVPQTLDSIVVVESTAKGAGQEFHHEWVKAETGESIFKSLFIPWYMMPTYTLDGKVEFENYNSSQLSRYEKSLKNIAKKEYDISLTLGQIAWRRWMIEKAYRGNEDEFNQEMPASPAEAFIVSGDCVFPKARLKQLLEKPQRPSRKAEIIVDAILDYEIKGHITSRDDGRLWIWKEPQPEHIYRIGVDPASGLEGRDFSAMQVIDEAEKEQVAEFQGFIDPITLAHLIIVLAHFYNDAKLAIELNYGFGTQIEAKRYYWNFYRHRYLDRITDKPTERIGFMTLPTFKKELLGYGYHCFENGVWKINSDRLKAELLTFIQRGDTELASAASGAHDDLVMAYLIAIYTSYQDKDYVGYQKDSKPEESDMLLTLTSLGVDKSQADQYTEEVSKSWLMD